MKRIVVFSILIAGLVFPLTTSAGENFSMGGSIGAISINGEMWYRVALQPVMKFNKLKVGLNLGLTWNDTDGIKLWEKEDWANLILFIQWAEKGASPLYFRIGDMQSATLGHGFILGGYSNMNQRAYLNAYRNIGLELDLNFEQWGLETVFSNIFPDRVTVYGLRPYVKPLKIIGSDIPVLSELAIGVSYATDVETGVAVDALANVPETKVNIIGADLDLPIIKGWLTYYLDVAQMLGHGNGLATGFMGGKGWEWFSIDYRFEYRNLGADFSPRYFDGYYEMGKPKLVKSTTERYNGWYGELNFGIMNAVYILVSYEDAFTDGTKMEGCPWLHAGLTLNENLFSITKQRINISAAYDYKNLGAVPQKPDDQMMQARFSYGVSENVDIIYVYTQKYAPDGQRINSTSIETKLHF